MSPEEFERLKAEEKAHLQQLRALKQQHRGAQRTASTAKALGAMTDRTASDNLDAATDKLMRDAAFAEARFELATDGLAPVTGNAAEVDREALAKAEAEALVRQMKAQMGGGDPSSAEAAGTAGAASAPTPTAPAGQKSIGRTPPPADEPTPEATRDAKSIGRQR